MILYLFIIHLVYLLDKLSFACYSNFDIRSTISKYVKGEDHEQKESDYINVDL